jgi:hypothetical protein
VSIGIICLKAVASDMEYKRVIRMRESWRRHKRLIGLAALFVTIVLLYLWMSLRPPLWFYREVAMTITELPARLVRPAFRDITGLDLPEKAEKLRSIYSGGRNPSVFVRFQTDSKGISYVREQLTEKLAPCSVEFESFTGVPNFPMVPEWQRRFGLNVIDLKSTVTGLRFEYIVVSGVNYYIIIDTQENNLYILASTN